MFHCVVLSVSFSFLIELSLFHVSNIFLVFSQSKNLTTLIQNSNFLCRQGIFNNNQAKCLTSVFALDLGTFSLAEYF